MLMSIFDLHVINKTLYYNNERYYKACLHVIYCNEYPNNTVIYLVIV